MARMSERGVNLEQGETITLKASGAITATAGTNGTAVFLGGERFVFLFLLNLTAAATEVDDTLDVYIDWSFDNSTYFNGGHFTQALGNGGAKKFYMIFGPAAAGVTDINVTSDQAVSTVAPQVFGPYVRARWVEVDAGGGASSFTFSVIGYAL